MQRRPRSESHSVPSVPLAAPLMRTVRRLIRELSMTKQVDTANSKSENTSAALTPDQALELWKHFASAGGADKNSMVAVASWVLGFSATIIGYIITQLTTPNSLNPSEPKKVILLSCLGMFISGLAAYVSFLYGGYANWNWANADHIADNNKWEVLLPDSEIGRDVFAACLVRPKKPTQGFAPVFWVFISLAIISMVVHLSLLIWSACYVE